MVSCMWGNRQLVSSPLLRFWRAHPPGATWQVEDSLSPRDQPRALTAPAVRIMQVFTHGSNQGIHGRRDRRLCSLPSSQHRDSALRVVALSRPEDRKTACS